MDMYDKKEAGKRLMEVIKESGLNSRQFAIKLNGDPSYLAKMEKGEKGISKTYLEAIEKLYGVSAQWLMFGTGGKTVPHGTAETKEKGRNDPVATEYELTVKVLADLAIAHRELAEANNMLTKNQETILARMPAGVSAKMIVDDQSRWNNLLELLAEVASGKRHFRSKQEALSELNKYAPLPRLST